MGYAAFYLSHIPMSPKRNIFGRDTSEQTYRAYHCHYMSNSNNPGHDFCTRLDLVTRLFP